MSVSAYADCHQMAMGWSYQGISIGPVPILKYEGQQNQCSPFQPQIYEKRG